MTNKQKVFCREYILNDFNGAEAARKAGYAKKSSHIMASQLLTNPNIQKEISKQIKAVLSELDKTSLKLLKSIIHASYFDVRKVVEWDNYRVVLKESELLDDLDAQMITEISQTKDGVKLKFVSKEKAWDMLAKFSKLIDPDNKPDETEAEKMSKEEQKKRLAYLLKKRGQ